jgi:dGTPase
VKDVVRTTEANIASARVRTPDDVRRLARPLVRYGTERRRRNLALRKYLYRNLYYNPAVHEPNQRAVRMLDALFRHMIRHPEDLSEGARRRIPREGLERAVCDYLAGMTDRFAMQEHARLCGVEDRPPEPKPKSGRRV